MGFKCKWNILMLQSPVVRMMQSLSMWNFKTRATIRRIFPSTLWFYKRMHSSQLHRWQNSQPPPTQSAEYAQQALAYLDTLASVMASQPHKETFMPRRMTGNTDVPVSQA